LIDDERHRAVLASVGDEFTEWLLVVGDRPVEQLSLSRVLCE
jgi:hypothetical protein